MSQDLTSAIHSALVTELELFHEELKGAAAPLSEADFWRRPLEPSNSVGHLVLHLTGNLNHFVGAHLGGTGYVRDREREFTDPNPPSKTVALAGLAEAVALFRRVVTGLTAEQLTGMHPDPNRGTVVTCLVHLVAHLALHRGQISYLVRVLRLRS